MIKKNLHYLIILVFIMNGIRAQQNQCGNSYLPSLNTMPAGTFQRPYSSVAQPSSFCSTPIMANYFDAISNLYVPVNQTPIVQYRVNFVFLLHPSIPGILHSISKNQIRTDAGNMVQQINSWFQSCGAIPATKPVPAPNPLLSDSKIRLTLNKVYFDSSSAIGCSHSFGSSTFNTQFPFDTDSTFNIFFYTETDQGAAGAGWAVPGKYCAIALPTPSMGGAYVPGTIFNNPRLLWHELGHGLGFLGDHYGHQYNIVDPSGGNYIPDDAAIDNGLTSSCSIPTGPLTPTVMNNNLMSGSSCREALSARQIAAFHYLVASNVTKKFTQFRKSTYPYSPFLTSPIIYHYSGDQSFNSQANLLFDSLIIKSGANVTFENMLLIARPGAKIVIEPGAILNLECVTITTQNENLFVWNGIDVCGNNSAPQNYPQQGILVINNSSLQNAQIAINVGKRDRSGEFLPNTGGGIVLTNGAIFEYNHIDVEFAPYVWNKRINSNTSALQNTAIKNNSLFKNSKFLSGLSSSQTKFACIILKNVCGVSFLSCEFNPGITPQHQVDYGILCLNSTFSIYSTPTSKSKISYFKNGIYANGNLLNDAIRINDVLFNVNGNNGVFLKNVKMPQVTGCSFNFHNTSAEKLSNGIYLSNCFGFKVENNVFYNNTSYPSSGIFVRQSGAYANAIYNNQFQNLNLGVWCIGENYDPGNGNGLLINCNEFSQCEYNVGIVKSNRINSLYGNKAGIAPVQGVSFLGDIYNACNLYDVLDCKPYDENKIYIDTDNDFVISSHGSYKNTGFHTDQSYNKCSNPLEVVDIASNTNAPFKGTYCPASIYSSLDNSTLENKVNDLKTTIDLLLNQQHQLMDGGNTQALLDSIQQPEKVSTIKNLLAGYSPFLSDTVLKSLIAHTELPAEAILEIHDLNKPVSIPVWKALLKRDFSKSSKNRLKQQQSQSQLSTKNQLLSKISILQTHYGLSLTEQLFRLATDSLHGCIDSLISFYNKGIIKNSELFKIDLLIQSGKYTEADKLLNKLSEAGGIYTDYVTVEREILSLHQYPHHRYLLRKDELKKQEIKTIAQGGNLLSEGIAAGLLADVWDIMETDEEKPLPVKSGIVVQTPTNTAIGVPEQKTEDTPAFLLYPNPAKQSLSIGSENTADPLDLYLFDLSGKLILKHAFETSSSVSISHLAEGIYIAQLKKKDELISVKKVMVIR